MIYLDADMDEKIKVQPENQSKISEKWSPESGFYVMIAGALFFVLVAACNEGPDKEPHPGASPLPVAPNGLTEAPTPLPTLRTPEMPTLESPEVWQFVEAGRYRVFSGEAETSVVITFDSLTNTYHIELTQTRPLGGHDSFDLEANGLVTGVFDTIDGVRYYIYFANQAGRLLAQAQSQTGDGWEQAPLTEVPAQ